jgi:hypothetical protein
VLATPLDPAALEMVATAGVAEFHVTDVVKVWDEPSEKVPVAAKGCVKPRATDGLAGVTVSDLRTAAVTLRVTPGLVTVPTAAEMVVLPCARD